MIERLYTIGHSTHPIEDFEILLTKNGVTAVADVRSHPQSKFYPQFNQGALTKSLPKLGIKYVFLGRELGARPVDPCCYEGNRADYDLIAKSSLFQDGLDRLIRGLERYRIAIMCAEKEPLDCHRTLLVARHAEKRNIEVVHILSNGETEPHTQTMQRLIKQLKLAQLDMFQPRHNLEDEAYLIRGKTIAYKSDEQPETQEQVVWS